MGHIDIHSLMTVGVRHTGRAHGALITLHHTACHTTPQPMSHRTTCHTNHTTPHVTLHHMSPRTTPHHMSHYTTPHVTPHHMSHYTTPHHTHTGFVRKTDTCVFVRIHLPSIVSGCFRKSEGLTVNLLPATFRVTLSPEGDVDSLEVGVASPLTLPSLELPLSGSESAS